MREIKFRGKHQYNETWIHGYYLIYEGYHKIIDNNGVFHDVDPETVGQYIGLKDKNSKEIYEGDTATKNGGIYIVKFNHGSFYFFHEHSGRNLDCGSYELEVIGNIHESK